MNENERYYLAEWLEGKLTDLELKSLMPEQEIELLKKNISEIDSWTLPELEIESSYQRLKEKRNQKIPKQKQVFLRPLMIAASITFVLLTLGFYYWNQNKLSTFETATLETKQVFLPDSSIAFLNSNSKISYKKSTWEDDRNLVIEGDVYFEVKKGKKFTVNHSERSTEVLGTKFEISDDKNGYSVRCFEGKVAVKNKNHNSDKHILTGGQGIRNFTGETETFALSNTSPTWITKEPIKFENAPLSEVIQAIERNYGVQVNHSIYKDKRYSGSIVLSDLELALKMFCIPLNLNYKINQNIVLLREN